MTEQHPITPPRELVEQWCSETEYATPGRVALHTISEQRLFQLLTRSAQWGYEQVNEAELQQARDEELEACCGWLVLNGYGEAASRLRAARRPKAPSLKEQALMALAHILNNSSTDLGAETIRRALEALPDD